MIEQSLWRAHRVPRFASEPLPHEVDVVIVGGGITGLTTAWLLKRAGKRVAVLERDRIGSGDTGRTTAHLTCVTDRRLTQLASQFGEDEARLIWSAGATAIDVIESIITELDIQCGFTRVDGHLCTPFFPDGNFGDDAESIQKDVQLARTLGFAARFDDASPLRGLPGMRIAVQALFHPLQYVSALAAAVDGDGSVVREHCDVGDVIDDPLAVIVNGENMVCEHLVIATHVPIVGKRSMVGAALFQTKLYPYSSYVSGARLPEGSVPPGLYWDTTDPYNYLRVHEDRAGLYGIFGGRDHKTGQETDTAARHLALDDAFRALIPGADIDRHWSGQVIETTDGLPYIGEVSPHQYVATGFSGNGMTFGTIAAAMMHDAIVGRSNEWHELFTPNRKPSSLRSLATVVSENVDYARYMLADRVFRRNRSSVDDIPAGGGGIVSDSGSNVAVHRRDDGSLVSVSAVCTHMGCLVRWNDDQRTWDCPCHGSRFTPDGDVLGGPAETPLEKVTAM